MLWWVTWLVTLLVSSRVLFFSTAHPMSPWNRDALVSLRRDLKLKVSMSTGLSDILEEVAGGFMSLREAQVVREQQGGSEQMDRLIETLLGKGDKDFSTFLQMLRSTNNNAWAEELERKVQELKGRKGVSRCRKELDHSEINCSMPAGQYRSVHLTERNVKTSLQTLLNACGPCRLGGSGAYPPPPPPGNF